MPPRPTEGTSLDPHRGAPFQRPRSASRSLLMLPNGASSCPATPVAASSSARALLAACLSLPLDLLLSGSGSLGGFGEWVKRLGSAKTCTSRPCMSS